MGNETKVVDLVKETKRLAQNIVDLMDDPHPGMYSWSNFLHSKFKELANLFGYDLVQKEEKNK
jgi:hypothetical protein